MDKLPKAGLPLIILAVIGVIIIMKTAVTIKAGEAGVLFKRFDGGVDKTKTYEEGFHLVAPWNDMIIYKVRQQEIFEQMKVLSSNGLEIVLEATAWYQPIWDELPALHQEKGQDYVDRIVVPAIRSAARSIVGRYTPDQLYSTKREAIQTEILKETRDILKVQHIQLNEVLVRNIELPSKIKAAIEEKLTKEQDLEKYKYLLQTAEKEAQRQRIDAEGKAAANKILSASLTDKILQEKGIEATIKLSESPNSKVIVIGSGKSGMPIILGNQ